MKKNLILIGIITSTIVLAVLSVVTALKIKQLGTQPIAPSVPKTRPKAVELTPAIPEIPPAVVACRQTFLVALLASPTPGPSLTPILTPSPGPSPTPSSTSTPGPTATSTPVPPTNTPRPITTVPAGPTPTEIQLPAAGLKLPTLGGIIAGFLLISIGAALVF